MHSRSYFATHIYYLHFLFYHIPTKNFTVKSRALKYQLLRGVVDRSEGVDSNSFSRMF